uniref:FH2 domain-containing protein n=1 Tax=Anopheles coluzzii TaxID=1518534 RepID=A0A8W7P0I2_ANOCL
MNIVQELSELRTASSVPDIASQLEVFDEQQECDVSQSLQVPDGIDLNSHLDVFNAILAQLIRNGEHEDIGAEKLRGLLKLLPEVDELEMLRAFDGDNNRLGNAEKFLLQLVQVPNYKLRIESMLLKEEFKANLMYLEPNIHAMLYAGEDLMNNKALQEVLYMVVVAGNFLNSGGYAGNAAGVKLSSLQKLTDIRANKPGMNLIHFVALQAEKKNSALLEFPGQLTMLENATKTTVEQISNEVNAIDNRIKKIKKQIELPKTEEDIKFQMEEFLSLDPLPEEKPPTVMSPEPTPGPRMGATGGQDRPAAAAAAGSPTAPTGSADQQQLFGGPMTYKRVYPNWRPGTSLEQTDVVGTIEALTGAASPDADKSTWRKSVLNTASSVDSADDLANQRYRRQRSREGPNPSSNLQSILEEDKRKNIIQSLGERPPSDRLQIYIRRGSDNPQATTPSDSSPPSTVGGKRETGGEEHKQSIYIRQPAADKQQQHGVSAGTPSTISSSTASTISGSELAVPGGGDTSTSPSSTAAVAPPPRRTRRAHHVYDESTNNKIEIDSDNIETPPSIRRNAWARRRAGRALPPRGGGSCRRLHHPNDAKDPLTATDSGKGSSLAGDGTGAEVLGDGQFDRFSSARRTRRFKRPIDLGASGAGSGNETTTTTATTASPSPDSLPDSAAQSPLLAAGNGPPLPAGKDTTKHEQEQRLKRWQDKLKSSTDAGKTIGSGSLTGRESPRSHAETVLNRASKVGRTISRISQEDVREAIRSLKSPTPERTWSPTKDIHQQQQHHVKGAPVTHELNDEGFEETQSLVSDTPSQGKDSVSSCNDYGSDTKSKRVVAVTGSPAKPPATNLKTSRTGSPSMASLLMVKNGSTGLERSRSLRAPPSAGSPAPASKNLLPRRTASMRRSATGSTTSVDGSAPSLLRPIARQAQDVERSNSRTSLRSSRSSLSSAVSTNTVRKVPPPVRTGPAGSSTIYTKTFTPLSTTATSTLSANSSPSKRPLGTATSGNIAHRGAPASRSSSSGSSIGPSATVVRKPPAKSAMAAKENQLHSSTSTGRIASNA